MHSTGSFLLTVLDRIRGYLDLPTSKYSNDYIVRHVIMPEMVNVLARLAMDADNPILVRHSFTTSTTEEYYQLPPNIGQIWYVARYDTGLRMIDDWKPRGERNPRGPGWTIEGNLLSVRPFVGVSYTWDVVYVPSGDFLPHYATDGELGYVPSSSVSSGTDDDNRKVFQLSASPTLGALDMRPNAYAGGILRILGLADGSRNIVEERVILSHDVSNGQVMTRVAFSHYYDDDVVKYEIAPPASQALYQAIAASSAVNLGVSKDVSEKKMRYLVTEYRKAIKTIGDNLALMQQRIPKHFAKDTVDNPDRYMWWLE